MFTSKLVKDNPQSKSEKRIRFADEQSTISISKDTPFNPRAAPLSELKKQLFDDQDSNDQSVSDIKNASTIRSQRRRNNSSIIKKSSSASPAPPLVRAHSQENYKASILKTPTPVQKFEPNAIPASASTTPLTPSAYFNDRPPSYRQAPHLTVQDSPLSTFNYPYTPSLNVTANQTSPRTDKPTNLLMQFAKHPSTWNADPMSPPQASNYRDQYSSSSNNAPRPVFARQDRQPSSEQMLPPIFRPDISGMSAIERAPGPIDKPPSRPLPGTKPPRPPEPLNPLSSISVDPLAQIQSIAFPSQYQNTSPALTSLQTTPRGNTSMQDNTMQTVTSEVSNYHLDSRKYNRTNQFSSKASKTPISIMNIDLGAGLKKKLYVFRDTDPWEKAFQFVESHDLPEEMLEDLVKLIEEQKMKCPDDSMSVTSKYKTASVNTATPSAKQPFFPGAVLSQNSMAPITTPAFGNSNQTFNNGLDRGPPIASRITRVEHTSEYISQPTSISPPLPPKPSNSSKPPLTINLNLDGNYIIGQRRAFNDSELSNSDHYHNHATSSRPRPPSAHASPNITIRQPIPSNLSSTDEFLMAIFRNIDVDGKGYFKSYELTFASLPKETKKILEGVLARIDSESKSSGFTSIDFSLFAKGVSDCGQVEALKKIGV